MAMEGPATATEGPATGDGGADLQVGPHPDH